MPSKTTDEPKLTLGQGDPEAGYVSPDLSLQDGVGTLPDEEQKAHDERDKAREDEVQAVAEHEHKVATERAKEAEGEPEPAPKAKASAAPSSGSS